MGHLDIYSIVPRSLSKKVVLQIFPVHDQVGLQELKRTWIRAFWDRQPIGKYCYSKLLSVLQNINQEIDSPIRAKAVKSCLINLIGSICEYFGVKIALYFAWLGHYTTALLIPAVVGIVFWVSYD